MRKLSCLSGLSVLLAPSFAFAEPMTALPSYGWLLAKTVFVLIGVCLLAFAGLKWLSGFNAKKTHGAMEIVARLPIEPRRSILVVRVGDRGLIVGSSESGMTSLGEMTPQEIEAMRPQATEAIELHADLVEEPV